jgi:hypothetical protein
MKELNYQATVKLKMQCLTLSAKSRAKIDNIAQEVNIM